MTDVLKFSARGPDVPAGGAPAPAPQVSITGREVWLEAQANKFEARSQRAEKDLAELTEQLALLEEQLDTGRLLTPGAFWTRAGLIALGFFLIGWFGRTVFPAMFTGGW